MAEWEGNKTKRPSEYRMRKDTPLLAIVAGLIGFGVNLGVDIVQNLQQGVTPKPEPGAVSASPANELKEHITYELKRRDKHYDDKFNDIKADIRELRVIVLSRGRQ